MILMLSVHTHSLTLSSSIHKLDLTVSLSLFFLNSFLSRVYVFVGIATLIASLHYQKEHDERTRLGSIRSTYNILQAERRRAQLEHIFGTCTDVCVYRCTHFLVCLLGHCIPSPVRITNLESANQVRKTGKTER